MTGHHKPTKRGHYPNENKSSKVYLSKYNENKHCEIKKSCYCSKDNNEGFHGLWF